jgi:hypothetical protein
MLYWIFEKSIDTRRNQQYRVSNNTESFEKDVNLHITVIAKTYKTLEILRSIHRAS